MLKTTVFALAALLACSIFECKEAVSMDISQFNWKNRLLFIFASNDGDPLFRALKNEIAAQPGEVSERDLIVFKISEADPSFMGTAPIDPQTAAALRNKFTAPLTRFTCILVGKDGGVKLRRDDQVKLKDIFALIDAMPMRREEIRQKAKVEN